MFIIDYLISVIFGIVEGITEWLPISSTGHMIILDEFLKLNVSEEFRQLYLVVIQLGAILAVIVLFWKDIWPFGIKNNSNPWKQEGVGRYIKADKFSMWFKIAFACIPAVAAGLFLEDIMDELFYNYICVSIMLILFGIAFIVVENRLKGKEFKVNSIDKLTYMQAFIIGLFQMIAAIFPGTSRSGSTIVGALIIGIRRDVAASFTFFMAIPVMLGASLIKVIKFEGSVSGNEIGMLITGMAVAFIVSFAVIKWLMSYIKKKDFRIFGWYRIILGILILLLGFSGIIG